MRRQPAGFSLVELITVIVLTALLSGIILQFSLSYMRYSSIVQSDSSAFVERLNASDYLRENLGMSTGLLSQNSIEDPSALVPDYDSHHWAVLYPLGGTSTSFGNSSSTTPLMYYSEFSKDTSGSLTTFGTTYYQDEYILYHDGPSQQLRVRTLANPNVTNNRRKTTCTPASATASCPADKVLINNITSVKIRYFSRAGIELSITNHGVDGAGNGVSPCPNPTYPYTVCDGATFSLVEVVELTLNLKTQPIGTHGVTTKSATVIRVALRNT